MRLKAWKVGSAAILFAAIGFITYSWSRREMPVTVSIIPSELSIGTERRLEPHLGLSGTAYFDLHVHGGPPSPAIPLGQRIQAWLEGDFSGPGQPAPAEVVVTLERWEKGQRIEHSESSFNISTGRENFISISLKDEGNKSYRIIIAKRNSTLTTHATPPEFTHPSQSSQKLEDPMILPIGEPVAVWSRVENDMTPGPEPGSWESKGRGTGTLDSEAEASDWALILRLKALDRTKGDRWKSSGGA